MKAFIRSFLLFLITFGALQAANHRTTLEVWGGDNHWIFCRDNPLTTASPGDIVHITGGVGWTPGAYTVVQYLSSYDIGIGTNQALMQLDASPAAGGTTGGAGYYGPTANPIGLFLVIGDSISTGTAATQAEVSMRAQLGYATWLDYAQTGTASFQWTAGSTLLNNAIDGGVAEACVQANVMLGTNDSRNGARTTATNYKANLLSMIGALRTHGFTKIYIHYPPCPVASTTGGDWDATAVDLLQQYCAKIDELVDEPNGVYAGSKFVFKYFQDHPDKLADGIHPNSNGYPTLVMMWLHAILVPYGTTTTSSGGTRITGY